MWLHRVEFTQSRGSALEVPFELLFSQSTVTACKPPLATWELNPGEKSSDSNFITALLQAIAPVTSFFLSRALF